MIKIEIRQPSVEKVEFDDTTNEILPIIDYKPKSKIIQLVKNPHKSRQVINSYDSPLHQDKISKVDIIIKADNGRFTLN